MEVDQDKNNREAIDANKRLEKAISEQWVFDFAAEAAGEVAPHRQAKEEYRKNHADRVRGRADSQRQNSDPERFVDEACDTRKNKESTNQKRI